MEESEKSAVITLRGVQLMLRAVGLKGWYFEKPGCVKKGKRLSEM